jgi:purine-nucleoside phosphorylase
VPTTVDVTTPRVERAIRVISRATSLRPEIGIALGSCREDFSRRLDRPVSLPYPSIPFFFQPLAPGHGGILSLGLLKGRAVAVLEGRIHLHEGYFMRDIVFPIRVLHRLGVGILIVVNGAGGLSPHLCQGQAMLVTDHLNLMGSNPLIGQIHAGRENPFLCMEEVYDADLRRQARDVAATTGENLAEGVLAAVPGPCFETPAERRHLASMGADAVTMSSIPEVIMARFLGLRVLCLTLIHGAFGGEPAPPTVDPSDATRPAARLMDLVSRIVGSLPPSPPGPAVDVGRIVTTSKEVAS